MKLQFLKESKNRLSEAHYDSPNAAARMGYRNAVIAYLKDAVKAFEDKGYNCTLKDQVLTIGYKKGAKILKDFVLPDSAKEYLKDVDLDALDSKTALETFNKEWLQELLTSFLTESLSKFSLAAPKTESILTEYGPIKNLFARMIGGIAKKNDELKGKVQDWEANRAKWSDVAANLAGDYTIKLGDTDCVVAVSAKSNASSASLTFKCVGEINFITATLQETAARTGYYFSEVKDFNGNKWDESKLKDIPVENVLKNIAAKFGITLADPKFNTKDAGDKENNTTKMIAKSANPASLNALLDSKRSDIVNVLLGVSEAFSDNITKYQKAFNLNTSGATDVDSAIVSFIISSDFPFVSKFEEKNQNIFRAFLIENKKDLKAISDKLNAFVEKSADEAAAMLVITKKDSEEKEKESDAEDTVKKFTLEIEAVEHCVTNPAEKTTYELKEDETGKSISASIKAADGYKIVKIDETKDIEFVVSYEGGKKSDPFKVEFDEPAGEYKTKRISYPAGHDYIAEFTNIKVESLTAETREAGTEEGKKATTKSTKDLNSYNKAYKDIRAKLGTTPTDPVKLFDIGKNGKPVVTKQFKELVKIIVNNFKNE